MDDVKNWEEEAKKCKESPLYFYNNYVVHEGHRKLTQEEWDARVKRITHQRNRVVNYPEFISQYPLTDKDVFKP